LANPKSELARTLRAALTRLGLTPNDTVVVGFSGGQDSTCLLHALLALHKRPSVVAAHIDHALRDDSAASAAQAADLARSMGVEAQVMRVDVASYKQQRASWSIQHAARAARYQALAAVVAERYASALLTAHTADDQAETLLLNLLRGTGLAGLAGMRLDEQLEVARLGPPLTLQAAIPAQLRLARPLLSVARSTTRAYCEELGLVIVEDASNASRAYTRNRVRLDLLPALERFNPAIRTVLARTADLAEEDLDALNTIVVSLYATVCRRQSEHEVELDLAAWRRQPRALQRRLLRHALEQVVGDLVDVKAGPIEDALELMRSGHRGQAYHLPYGAELCLSDQHAILRRYGRARRRNLDITLGSEAPRV
jgi:tRNA(Ile)-lysidine synthase